MKAILVRSGSVPVQSPAPPGSPRVALSRLNSFSSSAASGASSPRVSLHLDHRRGGGSIRRALLESDVIASASGGLKRLSGAGSLSFPARIPEEEEEVGSGGYAGIWPESGIPSEELGLSGGGFGKGKQSGGGDDRSNGGSGNDDLRKIGEYYEKMLKSNPGDSLLLRNYGKFLHEVEGDMERAEEYYGKAILASPGDGEVLSLYGKLIWESRRDGERAKSYFDQAVIASPDDCMVLGSYAHFMWEAEDEEQDEEIEEGKAAPAMVAAF